MTLDKAVAEALRATSTGTIHTVLLKKGIRRTWMHGPSPVFNADERIVGRAFTVFWPVNRATWLSVPDGFAAIPDAPAAK